MILFSAISHRTVSRSSNLFGAQTSGLYMIPQEVNGLEAVTKVSCSAGLTILLNDQQVFCFGVNKFGQCGVSEKRLHVYMPSKVADLPSNMVDIDAGFQHCIALSSQGDVFTWGKGKRGQLGDGKAAEFSFSPVKVKLPGVVITQVSAGFNHCAVLSRAGDVFIWGKHMSLTAKASKMGISL